MNDPGHNRVREVFHGACEVPIEQRGAFLDKACRDDAELRMEVESLLSFDAENADALSGVTMPASIAQKSEPGPLPDKIGKYRVLGVLGQGGMGLVYEAEQDVPRRRVALKVLSTPFTSADLRGRFQREAEVLGRLTHPYIAQIYEAGEGNVDAGGSNRSFPYIVMELVQGRPLLRFVEEEDLGTRNRLELVADICEGVHYAHQQGVIHRDLKPANILVQSPGPRPRILDFGVARMTDSGLQRSTVQTDIGELVGTIPYMSPEQVSANPHEIDIRTDVYSLGVILHELLAGSLPYDLTSQSIVDAAHLIRGQEPLPLGHLDPSLRGDVEIIVLKALEKDKQRRYQSANELAADIRRHLNDEPIVARPASSLYQARKFAKRHQALVSSIAITFVVLLVGMILSLALLFRATRAERESLSEASRATALAEFLNTMIAGIDPAVSQGADRTLMRTMVDRAAARVDADLADEPRARAAIHETLGIVYHKIDSFAAAETHLKKAVSLHRELLGPDHELTLESLNELAILYIDMRRHDDAGPLLINLLQARRRLLGERHASTIGSMVNLANHYRNVDRPDDSRPLYEKALRIGTDELGQTHPYVMTCMNNLANHHYDANDHEVALKLYESLLTIQLAALGSDHPESIRTRGNLGNTQRAVGDYAAAERNIVEALAKSRKVNGLEQRNTQVNMYQLGHLYLDLERYDEAVRTYQALVEIRRNTLSDRDPRKFGAMRQLGFALIRGGRPDDAIKILEEALRGREAIFGKQDRRVQDVRDLIREARLSAGRDDE